MPLSPRARRACLSAAVLCGFLALLFVLDHRGLDPSALRWAGTEAQIAVYGLCAVAAFASALAPPSWRRAILLVAALGAAPLALGAWAAVWLGFAASVIAIARAPIHVVGRVIASLVLWAVLPVARVTWFDSAAQSETILLAILWAGQLYSALYLVIERERELPELRSTVLADAFYLLALPRLVTPFFQPISPRQLARSERPEFSLRRVWRAAGLAAYAAGVAVLAATLGELARRIAWMPLQLGVRFCQYYAHVTYTIFTAIATFRLLGFDLPSGFRTPFLSRSFAEFFRRYNYYVRDAVVSLFYYPLLGRLRYHLSPRAATILSAYTAIVGGSFLFHDVLIPTAITLEPSAAMRWAFDPVRLLGLLGQWTLTVVPTAGLLPRLAPPRSRTRAVLAVVAFNAVYFALWCAQYLGRGRR